MPFSLCVLGETPVPTLGAADRVRVEAVVDDADAHGTYPPSLMGVTAVRTRDELGVHVSVVIPCLNEAENIAECVTTRAARSSRRTASPGEVIVADNGSDDGSGDLARAAGARGRPRAARGYGSAYLAGFAAAQGDYIVMADADLTYDFAEIPRFVEELDAAPSSSWATGWTASSRARCPCSTGSATRILSGFLNLLYRTNVGDVHCGMRALRRDVLPVLDLNSIGMEFASEMVIRAAREKLDVREIPIELPPARRASRSCRPCATAGATCA